MSKTRFSNDVGIVNNSGETVIYLSETGGITGSTIIATDHYGIDYYGVDYSGDTYQGDTFFW